MGLKDIIMKKHKKNKMISARVSDETKGFIKQNNINVSKLIEETIRKLKKNDN